MTNDFTRTGLLALVMLVLLVGLSYQWGDQLGSQPRLPVPPTRQVAGEIPQGEVRSDESSRGPDTRASASSGFTDADFTRHVSALDARIKKKLPSPSPHGFSIVIQKPFVVIGDERQEVVQERAEGTVKWAVDRLKQDFFTKDPVDILDIWLFKDEASYEKHVRLLFADTPSTPYGYYSPSHKALIMNIATGGGTLVHEIVHPFMEANFPACPPWLNEGLGSLYEQCGDVDGHIHGFTNWRLPGLQRAIQAKLVPSFKTLTEMDARAFYNDDKGTNYAQARYLCYYLQEQGVLREFYQEFLTRQKDDPGGFKSLQKVLAERDMNAFKTKWEKYVMGLRR
ncbi:MAG TPA: hypothetical protein VMS31_19055 [Pyrinomonadaceae bacterium]|nr:hypothetical protein [Pyrinomonadaceae bacterium]